jgi:hypothetical protein
MPNDGIIRGAPIMWAADKAKDVMTERRQQIPSASGSRRLMTGIITLAVGALLAYAIRLILILVGFPAHGHLPRDPELDSR